MFCHATGCFAAADLFSRLWSSPATIYVLFLFVYCGLLVVKIKSAEEVSLACVCACCFSLALPPHWRWLAVKACELSKRHTLPSVRAGINCRLKKQQLPRCAAKTHQQVVTCDINVQRAVKADTRRRYRPGGMYMTSLSARLEEGTGQ